MARAVCSRHYGKMAVVGREERPRSSAMRMAFPEDYVPSILEMKWAPWLFELIPQSVPRTRLALSFIQGHSDRTWIHSHVQNRDHPSYSVIYIVVYCKRESFGEHALVTKMRVVDSSVYSQGGEVGQKTIDEIVTNSEFSFVVESFSGFEIIGCVIE